jgi:hypothetical protein
MKKLAEVNNHPTGENSPNLVTLSLPEIQGKKLSENGVSSNRSQLRHFVQSGRVVEGGGVPPLLARGRDFGEADFKQQRLLQLSPEIIPMPMQCLQSRAKPTFGAMAI